jgi:CDP-6-deoxy-D-xylo-4-hexulose-3-dehydrase
MKNNISEADLQAVIEFLKTNPTILTQSTQVREFEEEWSGWLGVKHSVFVNSGSSANLITLAALREKYGTGEVIVPTLTWASDIAAVLHCGMTPIFVDINPRTLGMDTRYVLRKINRRTKAVFITHILGYNALDNDLLKGIEDRQIILLEDVSESPGATFQGRKAGTFGLLSNFSFYYAHHMSTIEGGMVSTNDEELHQMLRMYRSHGMVREATADLIRNRYIREFPDANPEFIFAFPAYNVRSTEINAVIGRAQLKHLDENNAVRRRNLRLFLDNLDPNKYRTDFATEGSCNYALTLILKNADDGLCEAVMKQLQESGVEYRRGTSGGGNQLRQPYIRRLLPDLNLAEFPHVDHVHFYGFYIGNYPELPQENILKLCSILNKLGGSKN